MAKIRPIHKNDERNRPINYVEQQGKTATVPWSTWKRNKRLSGQSDKTLSLEMTKTAREREPRSLPHHNMYTLFRLHFTPERNVHNSRADFFDLKRKDGETAADVWKRILEIKKNCKFETLFAAELLASKILSVIGKSTGDYDLKKKIRKIDMSVEAITDAIHEHMYEKMNDSPKTEEERRIRYLIKRKTRPTTEPTWQTDKIQENSL